MTGQSRLRVKARQDRQAFYSDLAAVRHHRPCEPAHNGAEVDFLHCAPVRQRHGARHELRFVSRSACHPFSRSSHQSGDDLRLDLDVGASLPRRGIRAAVVERADFRREELWRRRLLCPGAGSFKRARSAARMILASREPEASEDAEIPGRALDANLANAPTDLLVVLIFRILVKPLCRKYFAFPEDRIRCIAASSRPLRRAYRDRHDTWVRDAMDRAVSPDERCRLRTAKSRGPGAPTLASSLPVGDVGSSGRHAVIGRRRRLTSPALRGERV